MLKSNNISLENYLNCIQSKTYMHLNIGVNKVFQRISLKTLQRKKNKETENIIIKVKQY